MLAGKFQRATFIKMTETLPKYM